MEIWKLIPLQPDDRVWEQSIYNGVVFVRADSEKKARAHAMIAYASATPVVVGESTKFCPWEDPNQTSAHIDEESEYDVDGETEIVGPEEAVRNAVS